MDSLHVCGRRTGVGRIYCPHRSLTGMLVYHILEAVFNSQQFSTTLLVSVVFLANRKCCPSKLMNIVASEYHNESVEIVCAITKKTGEISIVIW